MAEIERYAITEAYEQCGRNVLRAARSLGISPRVVHYRLQAYRDEGRVPTTPASRRTL